MNFLLSFCDRTNQRTCRCVLLPSGELPWRLHAVLRRRAGCGGRTLLHQLHDDVVDRPGVAGKRLLPTTFHDVGRSLADVAADGADRSNFGERRLQRRAICSISTSDRQHLSEPQPEGVWCGCLHAVAVQHSYELGVDGRHERVEHQLW